MAAPSRILPLCQYPIRRGRCGASAPHTWHGCTLCCQHFNEFMAEMEKLVKVMSETGYEFLTGRFKAIMEDD